ncbi:MAG: diguanylate cyclase [Anaerolineaceae bacterium]
MTEISELESSESHYQALFKYSPIPLCEEDFSEVKTYLDLIRGKGVTDIAEYLESYPEQVDACELLIKIVDANDKALKLFGAASKIDLTGNLRKIYRDEMHRHFTDQLVHLWNGKLSYETKGVIYNLSGKPVDIQLHWSVMPGYEDTYSRVIVTLMDIGSQKLLEKELKASQAHYQALFQDSPVSLWVEDFSELKTILQRLRVKGIKNIRHHLNENPNIVDACRDAIKVTDVNRRTLELFSAKSKQDLINNLNLVFRDEMRIHFLNQLVDLWEGRLIYEAMGINYSLSGTRIDIYIHFTVMPGHEETWDRVLLSIEDMTARKKAEDYLRYFGTHDILTKLYNRTYFEEELSRLKGSRLFPVSIIVTDVDGLKKINDQNGHQSGDELIRRTAEVLKASFRDEDVVARIGGDEFAVIMPETDGQAGDQAVKRIRRILELNNKYYSGPPLNLSIGMATGKKGANLMDVQREADDRMYKEKRQHYINSTTGLDPASQYKA